MMSPVHGLPHAAPDSANATYYKHLAALLQPEAIEVAQVNSFTYTVASGVTKWILAAFNCAMNGVGRFDMRDTRVRMPVSGATLTGLASGAYAYFLDPTKPVFPNARNAYFDMMNKLVALPTRSIGNTLTTMVPVLPPPYGCIVTNYTVFDYAWLGMPATENEINDTTTLRFTGTPMLPVSKLSTIGSTSFPSGGHAGDASYSMSYVNLPASWSYVKDTLAPYAFREDFMGSSLDTTNTWNRTQSTAGNVEINTSYQWLKILGNGSFSANGLYTKNFSLARATGGHLIVDFCGNLNASINHNMMIGFSDGGGYASANWAHAVYFGNDGSARKIFVFENGTSRGIVGTWSEGIIYRIRITIAAGSNSATYEIQSTGAVGGETYAPLGGSTWTTLSPSSTSSTSTPLYPGATSASNTGLSDFLSDFRVY